MSDKNVSMKAKVDPAAHINPDSLPMDSDDKSQKAEGEIAVKAEMIPYAHVDHDKLPDGVGVSGPGASVAAEYLSIGKNLAFGLGAQVGFIPLSGEEVFEQHSYGPEYVCHDSCEPSPVTASRKYSGLMWNFSAMFRANALINKYFHVSGGTGFGGAHLHLDSKYYSINSSVELAYVLDAGISAGNETIQATADMNLLVGFEESIAAYPGVGARVSF